MQLTRLLVFAALVACSSSATTVSGGSFGGGAVAPTEDFAPPSAGSAPLDPPRCPAEAPSGGASCAASGTVCTYGPDVREDCNETYECKSGRWLHTTPQCASDCPRSIDGIAPGTSCADDRVACSYDEGTCGCVGDAPDPSDAGADVDASGDAGTKPLVPGVWKCVAPPTTVACPSARPRELDACVKRVACDYGTCELGRPLRYDCQAGFWQKVYATDFCEP